MHANLKPSLALRAIVPMPYHGFDEHSGANMLRVDPSWIDPVLAIDSYTMPEPFFGPHPHAGMSAVSLMLPEADGGFINRDSLGDHSLIEPGDLHWTQAGRGMMHEEVPATRGKAARGMQVFVNLRRKDKQADPVSFKVKHRDMPLVVVPGGSVRVVAGFFGEHASPITSDARWLTAVNMLDVTLEPGAQVDIPVAANSNAFFVIRSGVASVEGQKTITQSALIFASSAADGVAPISAGEQTLRGVFFSGAPINEPVVSGGPFTGNSQDDILQYRRAFAQGAMGHLTPTYA
jgi:redox-sensitive bicupin YhaK (pirin superfamily)